MARLTQKEQMFDLIYCCLPFTSLQSHLYLATLWNGLTMIKMSSLIDGHGATLFCNRHIIRAANSAFANM